MFDDAGAARGFMGIAQETKDGSLLWMVFDLGRMGPDAYLDARRTVFLLYRRRGGG